MASETRAISRRPEQSQSWLCENTHRAQCLTHQQYPRRQASMIMLTDDEKEASKMCVVFIGRQKEGTWRRKHA